MNIYLVFGAEFMAPLHPVLSIHLISVEWGFSQNSFTIHFPIGFGLAWHGAKMEISLYYVRTFHCQQNLSLQVK